MAGEGIKKARKAAFSLGLPDSLSVWGDTESMKENSGGGCEYSQGGTRVQKEQPRLRNCYSLQLVLPFRGRLGTTVGAVTLYHSIAASSAEFKQWCLPQNRSLGPDPAIWYMKQADESWGMHMAELAEALKFKASIFST